MFVQVEGGDYRFSGGGGCFVWGRRAGVRGGNIVIKKRCISNWDKSVNTMKLA